MSVTVSNSKKINNNINSNNNKKLNNVRRNTLVKEWMGSNSINISE